MTMLVVDGVFSGYGKSQVLHGVSLSVNEGEIVALIGANGAGKTTLLKTISGLVQAQSGTIRFQNTEIQNLSAHRIVESGVSQGPGFCCWMNRRWVLRPWWSRKYFALCVLFAMTRQQFSWWNRTPAGRCR